MIPRRAAGNPAAATGLASPGGPLTRQVLGFAPYWELGNRSNWNYSLLSMVAYFGLNVNGDGSFNTSTSDPGWNGWNSTQLQDVITKAHLAGDRVLLVIKAFNDATICPIITNPTNTQAAITNTISAIQSKGLDGVNVDFEGNSSPGCPNGQSIQTYFTDFIQQLSSAIHQHTGWVITADTYVGSASWDGGIFKIGDLAPLVDGLFIMAYDIAVGGNTARANAPLNGGTYNDTTAVAQYLSKAPASKVILGVPYYGYKWSTTSNQPSATVTSGAEAVTYAGILSDFACVQQLGRSFDWLAQSPWAAWWRPAQDPCSNGANTTATWRELYFDDTTSLALKYDLVNADNLLGTGMWALGYDGASKDLWRALAARFTAAPTTFYFAEGFTGAGFTETLSLYMPNQSGNVLIDYYTDQDHLPTQTVAVTAGQAKVIDVNAAVGANRSVAARVSFPATGIAERTIHFNTGSWHGSTDQVGSTAPSTEWDFAEGSTFSAYSEYLTLENFNATPVGIHLNYATDNGAHPQKTLTLPAQSRTTVLVFGGDLSSGACTADATGSCGVGGGVGGVSVQVVADSPIVAERPMYVNNFNFGSGAIRDGHDAFGANGPALSWNFAEGSTFNGFNEYLTLQNPNAAAATVDLKYVTDSGRTPQKTLTIPGNTRSTVLVFQGDLSTNPACVAGAIGSCGVGRGIGGVSVQVNSRSLPIVAERSMYMVVNFGTGSVAGAHDVVGATATGNLYDFPSASTLSGDSDFLTIESLNPTPNQVTMTFFTTSGPIVRTVRISPNTRQTVRIFGVTEGAGPGFSGIPIMVAAEQPIVVERPTYGSNAASYGATDTLGYSAVKF